MIATSSSVGRVGQAERRRQVSFPRLLWVAPLTLVTALAACFALRLLVQALFPSAARMPQLGQPMVTLVMEGVLAAIVVFAVFAVAIPRPIFWYRVVGTIALLVSLLPDVALMLGGQWMGMAMRYVGPLTSIGMSGGGGNGGPPPGGGPGGAGGPPPGFLNGMPLPEVMVLMLLHIVVAVVCIVLLTTLTRRRADVRSGAAVS
ncbi:MAG TPA: hypothetical protein VGQ62_20125 [Chloroflexota bacterium]|nr:hypothetical protein [Chloroflexota bacterium]